MTPRNAPMTPSVRVLANGPTARKIGAELTRRGFLATALAASGAVLFTACAPEKAAAASCGGSLRLTTHPLDPSTTPTRSPRPG